MLVITADILDFCLRRILRLLDNNCLFARGYKSRDLGRITVYLFKLQEVSAGDIVRIIGDLCVLVGVGFLGKLIAAQRIRGQFSVIDCLGITFEISDINAVIADLYLFGYDVCAHIVSVHIKVYGDNVRGNFNAHIFGKFIREQVTHKRSISGIGKQTPLFCFTHSEQVRLFCELDVIWLFVAFPCRVSSTLDIIECAVIHNRTVAARNHNRSGILVFLVGVNQIKRA